MTPEYLAAVHGEAAYDGHAAGRPHDTEACGVRHPATQTGETP